MRALLYAASVSAWALLCVACLSAPKPKAWLAVGYRSPEQTFQTFKTGLRADWPDLEYRCLGQAFKRRSAEQGAPVTEFTYLEVRKELFGRKELPDGRVRLTARVETWFHDEVFAIDFAPEDFYELWVGDKRVNDDFASWRSLAREKNGQLVVSVPLPSGLGALEVGELRAGREWKIDGFPLLEDATP